MHLMISNDLVLLKFILRIVFKSKSILDRLCSSVLDRILFSIDKNFGSHPACKAPTFEST